MNDVPKISIETDAGVAEPPHCLDDFAEMKTVQILISVRCAELPGRLTKKQKLEPKSRREGERDLG